MTAQDGNGRRPRISTVRASARGEDFRVVQLQGNLFVCAQQHGSCCCGWAEKGRMPFDVALCGDEWERRRIRNRLHLTMTGCLGPCPVGNNVLLQLLGRSIWLKDLNDPALVPAVLEYAEAMLAAGRVLPPPQARASRGRHDAQLRRPRVATEMMPWSGRTRKEAASDARREETNRLPAVSGGDAAGPGGTAHRPLKPGTWKAVPDGCGGRAHRADED